MKQLRAVLPVALTLLLAACGGTTTPPTPAPTPTPNNPVTPGPVTPGPVTPEPVTPIPVPVDPINPDPGNPSTVPFYGEWVIDFTSDVGVSFRHALQITTDVSTDDLRNAGGGLQEFCTGGGPDDNICEGIYGSGFGFMGELLLDDGTAPLSMGIFEQYDSDPAPELKIFTVEPISITTNGQGQETFTADAAWNLSTGDLALGTITATNVGAPRTLDPLQAERAAKGTTQLRLHLSR